MKGTSEVIMGATLVMVVSLAVVLGLILVLLAELYCSLLLRRRQLRNSNSNATPTTTTPTRPNNASPSQTSYSFPREQSPPRPFSSICGRGVLQAPRNLIFPDVACKEDIDIAGLKKQHSERRHQVVEIQTQESNASPRLIGFLSAASLRESFISKALPKPMEEVPLQGSSTNGSVCTDKSCSDGEHLVFISNPIYENEESKDSEANTPFETPDTSPSRLERSGSSGEEHTAQCQGLGSPCGTHSPSYTPPLTPMKKLPAAAEDCSVSVSDSRSNHGLSSYSGSPCTSPSW